MGVKSLFRVMRGMAGIDDRDAPVCSAARVHREHKEEEADDFLSTGWVTARLALEQNRDVFAVPGSVTNKNSWGPNTLVQQGAKLVPTWEDVWEDLPTEVRLAPTPPACAESADASPASLFPDDGLPPHARRLVSLLKADEVTRIETLESEMSFSEIVGRLICSEVMRMCPPSPRG